MQIDAPVLMMSRVFKGEVMGCIDAPMTIVVMKDLSDGQREQEGGADDGAKQTCVCDCWFWQGQQRNEYP